MKQRMRSWLQFFVGTGALMALGSVLVVTAQAQSSGLSMGDSAKKFTLPVSDGGEVKMKISGDEATKLSVNRTEIINMKIELMNKGLPETIITSPRAYFWTLDQRLQTRNGVRIDRGDMQITAKSMEWQLKNEKGTLRREVMVKLIGFDLGDDNSMKAASRDLGGAIPVKPAPKPDTSDTDLDLGLDDKEEEGPSIFSPNNPSTPSSPTIPGVPSLPSGGGEKTEPDSLF